MADQTSQPQRGSAFSQQAKNIGVRMSTNFAGRAVRAGATRFAASRAGQALVTTAAKFGASKLGTAVGGALAGPAGAAAGWLGGKLIIPAARALKDLSKFGAKALAAMAVLPAMILAGVGSIALAVGVTTLGVVLGIIVTVALILFIINAGAYVVPAPEPFTQQSLEEYQDQQQTDDFQQISEEDVLGQCESILVGGVLVVGSYNPASDSGHGSNPYWARMRSFGYSNCEWPLPETADPYCNGPTVPGNVCSGQAYTCDVYGYAADIYPTTSTTVVAPSINGESLVWDYEGSFSNFDAGFSYVYRDLTNRYYLVVSHLTNSANTGGNIVSGETIGQLFPMGNRTHLHVELQLGGFQTAGTYVRPEDYLCNLF